MQIARILQSQGFGTRRECRALVRAGHIEVDGVPVDDPFTEFDPQDLSFSVDGEPWRYREKAYLALNKPTGYECSRTPSHHPSIFELLPSQLAARGVQPVGRLDQDTSGLLLLSDDGQFIHQWSSGKKRVPKRYHVTLKHACDTALVETLLAGVQLHDEPAPIAAAACTPIDDTHLWLTVTEGKYHQVKRMVAAAGNRVEALHRATVGGLALPADLAEGSWCWLGESQRAALADQDPPAPIP